MQVVFHHVVFQRILEGSQQKKTFFPCLVFRFVHPCEAVLDMRHCIHHNEKALVAVPIQAGAAVLIPEYEPFLCQAGQVPDHLVCIFLHSKSQGSRQAVDHDKSLLQAWQSEVLQ